MYAVKERWKEKEKMKEGSEMKGLTMLREREGIERDQLHLKLSSAFQQHQSSSAVGTDDSLISIS